MNRAADPPAGVRLLLAVDPPGAGTRFVDQIVTCLPRSVSVDYFSWRHVIFGSHDVVHFHWPEFLVRSRVPGAAVLKRTALRWAIRRWDRRGTAVVRTLHNPVPHEASGAAEQALLDGLLDATTLFIRLTDLTPVPRDRPVVTIRHGDYRRQFAEHPKGSAQQGHVLFFGLIRPYKGLEELLETFETLQDPDLRLRVVGKPQHPPLVARVRQQERRDARVSSRLAFVPDAYLVSEVTRSALVALPYREMHNSGALLVALSLGRPVLVPRSSTTEQIAAEVGARWVHLFDGPLTAAALLQAIAGAAVAQGAGEPDLRLRDWDSVGRQHADAYGKAIALRRSR